ncbi:hypothetical protein [Clostridium magnum]|nr:hypothetical protein [Clostridium magnum]SHJ28537.1 hypothetical protein SAMN02745944_05685 [Clostridium magnum DSM 2767]
MEIIIVGDSSKMVENFTRAMFEITMNRIKEGKEIIPSNPESDKKPA